MLWRMLEKELEEMSEGGAWVGKKGGVDGEAAVGPPTIPTLE